MRLQYRGVNYEPESTNLEMYEGEIGGKYLGQEWHYHYPRHLCQVKPKLYRQYRGVAYSTRALPLNEISVSPSNHHTASEQLSSACLNFKKTSQVNEISQIHLDNIRRNLERRLAVAKAKGDDTLVNLLQKESENLALN